MDIQISRTNPNAPQAVDPFPIAISSGNQSLAQQKILNDSLLGIGQTYNDLRQQKQQQLLQNEQLKQLGSLRQSEEIKNIAPGLSEDDLRNYMIQKGYIQQAPQQNPPMQPAPASQGTPQSLSPAEKYTQLADAGTPDTGATDQPQSILSHPAIIAHAQSIGWDPAHPDYTKNMPQTQYGLERATKRSGLLKSQQDLDQNAPYTPERVRAILKGQPDLAEALIKANPDGSIARRDIQDAIAGLRPDILGGLTDVKRDALRLQLNKEARDTLLAGGVGKDQIARLNNIGRTEPLIAQMLDQPGGGDPRQMRELATRIDSVLRGTPNGQQAIEGINALVPQTARGKFASWLEWFSNNPQGTEQQSFIKRYADTLGREKNAIQGQVAQMAESRAPTLRLLKQHYPEDYQAQLDSILKNPQLTGEPTGASGGKIKVSNGNETLMIDPQDEQDAAGEGFRRVQ
jgi:hypothetical protein